MYKKIFPLIVAMTTYFFAISQESNTQVVYFKDSISTVKYLNSLNLCDKISYAEKSIQDIIKLKGYSSLILQSISKDSKRTLYIATINGNMIVPDERLVMELKEQLNDIKLDRKCP